MPSQLLLRLAREMAESNRRAAAAVEAESWQSATPQEADALRRRGARAAQDLTRFTLSRRAEARDVWDGALEVLREGATGEESREVLQVVQDISDSWLALAQKTRELWRDVTAASGAAPEGLDELDAAEREVKEVKAAAEKMHAFLARTRTPLDPALLRQGREEVEQGRFKTPEEMRSRLGSPRA
jgi:hypothetical protein